MKKKLLTGLATGFFVFGMVGMASAVVITFDDVTGGDYLIPIPNGYAGFDWNMSVIKDTYHAGSGYDLGTVSGAYTAWYHEPASVTSAADYDFNGAYFASAWDEVLNVVLEGWNNGTKIYDTTISVFNSGPTWIQANFLGIDELHIRSLGQQFVMDNFTYNSNNQQEVPEPATMLLFGSGLAGLVGARIRKKKI